MRVCTYCHQLLSEGEAACPRDGSSGQEVQLARPGGQLGARFPAIEPLGRGGTGSLFLAVQAQSGYRGLLKIVGADVGGSPTERARMKRELRKQTTLAHAGLARILDGGEVGAELWLFREYVDGESLAIRVRRGALPVPEALAVTAQVGSALDELHRQGLLHRDVKPGHVLLTARPDAVPLAKLIDAGLAARLPSDSVFEVLGTPAYTAPEVIAGKPASFRSDLYSLGCVLYEMLTGSPPFTGDTVADVLAAHRDRPPAEPSAPLPAPVRALLHGLLAKEPRKRPFSAQQVRRTLDPHLPATTPQVAAASRPAAARAAVPQAAASAATLEIDIEPIAASEPPPETWPELHTDDIDVAPLDSTPETAPDALAAAANIVFSGAEPDGPAAAPEPVPPAQAQPEPEPEPEPAAAARRAVDFDVESLFGDETAPERPVVITHEPERAPPAFAAAASRDDDDDAKTTAIYVPRSEPPVVPDPDGTVVIARRRTARGKASWPLFAVASVLLLVALVLALRPREAPTPPPPDVAAAAPQPEPAPAPRNVAAGRPAEAQRAAAEPEPSAAEPEPSAAEPEPSAAEPEPSAAEPERAGTSRGRSAPAPVAYKPPPQAEPGVDYKTRGRELYQAGRYREAAEAYERAAAQSPSDAGAFAGLGASYLAARQPDRAIIAYQRAVQLRPQVSGFQAALGRAYLQKGDRFRAAAAYRKALDLDPNNQAAAAGLRELGQ